MKQFTSFVKKEARHILRDKRTVLFGIPVVMMLLFGFAIFVEGRCTIFVSGWDLHSVAHQITALLSIVLVMAVWAVRSCRKNG